MTVGMDHSKNLREMACREMATAVTSSLLSALSAQGAIALGQVGAGDRLAGQDRSWAI